MCVIGYLALNEALTLTLLIPFALAFGIFEIAHWTTWSAFLGDVVKKHDFRNDESELCRYSAIHRKIAM